MFKILCVICRGQTDITDGLEIHRIYVGCRGRVIKAMDSKSIEIFPRRFESCRQCILSLDFFFLHKNIKFSSLWLI